jgi:lycopene cyclase domain-containing protein
MRSWYVLLDGVFLILPASIIWRSDPRRRRSQLAAVLALIALTLVFDNVIIAAGIVAYDPARNLGLKIGLAPIEDFAYAIWAAITIPWLWERGRG